MAAENLAGAGEKQGNATLTITEERLGKIVAAAAAAAVREVIQAFAPVALDDLRAQRELERKQETARLAVKPWDHVVKAGSRAYQQAVQVTLRPTMAFWQGDRKVVGGPQGTPLTMSFREAWGARGRINEQEVVDATERALRERYLAETRALATGKRSVDPVPLEFAIGERDEDRRRPFTEAAHWPAQPSAA